MVRDRSNSDEGKKIRERYTNSDRHKELRKLLRRSENAKRWREEYKASGKHKAWWDSYMKTDKYKDYRHKYTQTEKRKAYLNSEEGRKKSKEALRKYYSTAKGKANALRYNHKRRIVGANIVSNVTKDEWDSIKKKYRNRCVYCGEEKKLTIDHIIPVSKGGNHVKENIVPACISCNSRKGDRPVLLQLLVV